MYARRPIVVQKFGGSSVASIEKLQQVAKLIESKKRAGFDVVVVVSAMGDTTDDLLSKAKSIAQTPDRRELDMLLSAGERISTALLAMALKEVGIEAISLTGSQSGIMTTAHHAFARIMEVRPFRVQDEIERGKVVVVAGFQGVSYTRDITTLGRGGSDTTAVALAAALDAEACEIYSDVDGVLSADPRTVPNASHLSAIGYEEMQELAESGARVLNADAVEFAKQKGIAIYARKTGSDHPGTVVRRDIPRPISGVRGIAHQTCVGSISGVVREARQISRVLAKLEELGCRPKQVHLEEGKTKTKAKTFSCVVGLDDVLNEAELRDRVEALIDDGTVRLNDGTVSLIGDGIMRDRSNLERALDALDAIGLEPQSLSTSSFRVSFLLRSGEVVAAVRHLHDTFGLGRSQAEAIMVL